MKFLYQFMKTTQVFGRHGRFFIKKYIKFICRAKLK